MGALNIIKKFLTLTESASERMSCKLQPVFRLFMTLHRWYYSGLLPFIRHKHKSKKTLQKKFILFLQFDHLPEEIVDLAELTLAIRSACLKIFSQCETIRSKSFIVQDHD